ncbi:MAG: NusG domain II-containing protein [Clostridia bacterium]|nr:NusG domain II-containing protein [Eubacteriales bacterium]NCC47680.1 NusG domain II-containing protein [Clostridia bacterium]
MADHPDNNTAGTASFDRARRNVTIPWYRELRWGDWLLYLLIAGLAVGLMTGLIGPVRQRAVRAVLSDSGRTIAQFDLSAETESGSKAIDAHGHHYVLEWEEGRIRFAEADCPDQICVRTGWISRSGDMAACVPGQLVLRIEGEAQESDDGLDVIIR